MKCSRCGSELDEAGKLYKTATETLCENCLDFSTEDTPVGGNISMNISTSTVIHKSNSFLHKYNGMSIFLYIVGGLLILISIIAIPLTYALPVYINVYINIVLNFFYGSLSLGVGKIIDLLYNIRDKIDKNSNRSE